MTMSFDSLMDTLLSRAINWDCPMSGDEFDTLALKIFAYQYEHNAFYRRYCDARRATAAGSQHDSQPVPSSWLEIPALPTNAFKRAEICCFPAERRIAFFKTSGTTDGETGRHYFSTLAIYEAAIVPNFKQHLLPDEGRLRMLILTPPPAEAPHSSLVHMMKVVREHFGTDDSFYCLREGRWRANDMLDALHQSETAGEPVFLLGTAFAFVFMLDEMVARGANFRLPEGSRVMETGGFKGRAREIPHAEFYASLCGAFGIPPHRIVNEYGMTELSSQFYDTSLADGAPGNLKSVPPWTRVLIVDPLSGHPVPDGVPGLIRIVDLANLGSVIALQTEDVGIMRGGKFEMLGRVASAPPRGCSLAVEDLMNQQG